jgi:NADH-quinone oxidoreductase subunit N
MRLTDLELIGVEIYLAVMILTILGADLLGLKRGLESLYVLGLSALFFIPGSAAEKSQFGGMISGNPMPWVWILTMGTLLSAALQKPNKAQAESYALMLGTVLGLVFMARSSHLIMLIVGAECASFCSYGLVGLQVSKGSTSVKYLVFGAIVSAVSLYSASWLYGFCGSLSFEDIVNESHRTEVFWLLAVVAMSMLFKLAAFPLQQWMPEVVEGSPSWVSAFLAVVPKLGAAVALQHLLPKGHPVLLLGLSVLAVGTVFFGNFLAIKAKNLKTMLAYAAIAQSAFLLLAVAVSEKILWFYLLVNALMGVGIFILPTLLEQQGETREIDKLKALNSKPLAICATIFAASMAGLPLTAGFTAKFMVFAGFWPLGLGWAAVLLLVSLPLSWAYLLRVPYYLWVKNSKNNALKMGFRQLFFLYFISAALIALFLLPDKAMSLFFRS